MPDSISTAGARSRRSSPHARTARRSQSICAGTAAPPIPRMRTAGCSTSRRRSLVVSLPTREQGTDLLAGAWAAQVEEHFAAFFDEQRSLVGRRQLIARRPTPPEIFQGGET